MKSPFFEVYLFSNEPEPAPETVEIDLQTQLEEDCEAYRMCGLECWADDIQKLKRKIKFMGAEKKESLAKELRDGGMIIFMPGRAVQFANAVETLTKKLKPFFSFNGSEKPVGDSFWPPEAMEVLEKIAKKQTQEIPEQPYLCLTRPANHVELTSMTVAEQIKEIKKINKIRKQKKLLPVFSILPPEYVAMQKSFTERLSNLIKTKKINFLVSVMPFDLTSRTRFVSMLQLFRDLVPAVSWSLTNNTFYWFTRDGKTDREDTTGVRLVERIEL